MILCSNPKEAYLAYKDEIDGAISRTLNEGIYILGNEVKLFEKEFSSYIGVKYAIGVGSGTDALHLSLKAFDIGEGDEVITVSHTAVATISAIVQCRAKPVFVDIESDYFTIDPEKIERAITKKTKAIIAVHLYGQPCNLDSIISIAERYNLKLIEDCAQAHGSTYFNKKLGSFGNTGCFSFYPTKNLGCIGDGGIVTTDDEETYLKIKLLREYGWKERYISHINGLNSRLDEIQAAILRIKLKHLESDNNKRRNIALKYNGNLTELGLTKPVSRANADHVYHLYVIRTKKRNELKDYLFMNNILALIHYPVPVHLQNAYKDSSDCILNVTEKAASEILSLPMYPELKDEEVNYIIDKVSNFKF